MLSLIPLTSSFACNALSGACGALAGLVYAYCHTMATRRLFAQFGNAAHTPENNNVLKGSIARTTSLLLALRCFFVLVFFAVLRNYFALNLPLCGATFITTFLIFVFTTTRK